MLDHCAPGYSKEPKVHHWWVRYNGRTFRALPLGAHGARKDAEIEAGHVRKIARHLLIEPCARRLIPAIW
jgi:hypothetical protein